MRIHDTRHCAVATLRENLIVRAQWRFICLPRGSSLLIRTYSTPRLFHVHMCICMRVYMRACALPTLVYIRKRNCIGNFSFYVAAVEVSRQRTLFSIRLPRLLCLYNALNTMSLRIVAQAKSHRVSQPVSQLVIQSFPF